jgi:hypothetical protein
MYVNFIDVYLLLPKRSCCWRPVAVMLVPVLHTVNTAATAGSMCTPWLPVVCSKALGRVLLLVLGDSSSEL